MGHDAYRDGTPEGELIKKPPSDAWGLFLCVERLLVGDERVCEREGRKKHGALLFGEAISFKRGLREQGGAIEVGVTLLAVGGKDAKGKLLSQRKKGQRLWYFWL